MRASTPAAVARRAAVINERLSVVATRAARPRATTPAEYARQIAARGVRPALSAAMTVYGETTTPARTSYWKRVVDELQRIADGS